MYKCMHSCLNIICFGVVDFSMRRPEEVMFLFTLNVDSCHCNKSFTCLQITILYSFYNELAFKLSADQL